MKGFVWSRMGSLAFQWSAAVWLTAFAGSLFAHSDDPSVRSHHACWPGHYVDGQFYNSPRVFCIRRQQAHLVDGLHQLISVTKSVTVWRWSSNLGTVISDGVGNTIQITVDPRLTEITATFSEQYEVFVSLRLSARDPQDQPCFNSCRDRQPPSPAERHI
jgi:hypothetical protein